MDSGLAKETVQKNKKLWGLPMRIRKFPIQRKRAKSRKARAVVDGDSGTLKGSTKRTLDSLSLFFWLLRQERVPPVFLGTRSSHTSVPQATVWGVQLLVEGRFRRCSLIQLDAKSVE